MSNIVRYQGGPPAPAEWAAYKEMAQTFSQTEFVPQGLRNRPEAVLAAIVSGHELGIGPMQALKHIAIVNGKPSPSAELMVALVRKAGHSLKGESTPERAIVKGRRHDTQDEMAVEWTMEMAQRAGLAGKGPWKTYPEAMLWARAVSQLCRMLFSDVIAGMGHTPEELGAEVDQEGNVIEAQVVEPQKGGEIQGGGASQPPKDIGAQSPPDSSQANSENERDDAVSTPPQGSNAASPTAVSTASPASTPKGEDPVSEPSGGQGAGVLPWEAISNAVDAGIRNRKQVLQVMVPLAAKQAIHGIEWDDLPTLPEELLSEAVSRLGLTQEAMI